MFVSKRAFLAATDEIVRLQRELEQAKATLAQYKLQERDLLDALVAARAEARQVRNLAESQARELVDRARAEAGSVQAEAQAQTAAVQSELARLRFVQRELSASLQQSLSALGSVMGLADGAAAPETGPAPKPHAPAPAPPALAALIAAQREAERRVAPVSDDVATPAPRESGVEGRQETHGTQAGTPRALRSFLSALPSWGTELSSRPTPRTMLLAGTAILVTAFVAVAAGVPALWRGAGARPRAAVADVPSDMRGEAGGAPRAAEATSGLAAPARSGADAPVTVLLRSVRPVWVRAHVDGKPVLSRHVRQGEDLEFRGSRDVLLRAGDAGALLVSVNGSPQTPLGPDGTVLTKRIAGEPPTAAVTSPATAPAQPAPGTGLPTVASPRPGAPVPPTVSQGAAPQLDSGAGRATLSAPALPRPQPVESASAASATGISDDETAVLRAHDAYFQALARGDSATVARLVADGFSAHGIPGGDAGPVDIGLSSATIKIQGVGAVVSGTATHRLKSPDGQPLGEQPLLFSEVWIKRDGEWQLLNVRFASARGQR